jgi:hypothetical protein
MAPLLQFNIEYITITAHCSRPLFPAFTNPNHTNLYKNITRQDGTVQFSTNTVDDKTIPHYTVTKQFTQHGSSHYLNATWHY